MAHFARIAIVIGFVWSCETLFAQLPTSRLDLISPAGGRIGTEVEVTVSGAELDDCDTLVFSHTGITATQKLSVPDEIDPTALPVARTFRVKIAGDVAAGVYEVRAAGPLGMTNPRMFAVGNLEAVAKSGNPRTLESAMELPLGVVATGNVDPGTCDYYSFSAKQSQRVLIDCYGQRIGSRIDATLVLFDSDGKRLKRVRDVAQLDPVIDFDVPADGEYFVGVYDFEYNGGSEYFYRLALHEGPFVSFVFPPVAASGSENELTFYGHNLPGSKPVEEMSVADSSLESVSVSVALGDPTADQYFDASLMETPATSSLARELFRLETSLGKANPVPIGYATAPLVLEQEPNNESDEIQRVETPCEVVGQFYPRGDRDVISFHGEKGKEYWIELFSSRLGAASDAHMLIEKVVTNEKGEQQVSRVAEVDDEKPMANQNTVHGYFHNTLSDPSYKLTADADARYRVTIKDLFGNTNNDPRFVYRLLIREQQPDFDLMAYAAPTSDDRNRVSPSSTILPRGGNTSIAVQIRRVHGFEGDVEISAEGLPEGVICHGAVASGKVNQVSLIFGASENAKAWSGPIRVVGKAKIADQDVTRRARVGTFIWGTQNAQQQPPVVRIVSDISLSVIERQKAPLSVQLGDGKVMETSRGAKLEIPIKAVRGEDVPDDLKMKMVFVPGVNLKETVVKGNEGTYPLEVTDQRFTPGVHTVYLTGTAKYKYKGDTEAITKAEEESKRLESVVKQFTEQQKQVQDRLREAQEAAKKEKENQSLADAVKTADEEAKRLADLLTRAQQRKQVADKRLNDTRNKNKPRDINLPFVSTPVRLKVAASPVTLRLDNPSGLKQGDTSQVVATIEKKFDFDDQVDITVEFPGGVKGVTAKPLKIEKGQTEGKLELLVAGDATPGTHTVKVRTRLKFNNVNIDTTEETTLTIQKADETAGTEIARP